MLCMNSYKQAYVDECRASMEAQLAAYKTLLTARAKTGTDSKAFNSAAAALNHSSSITSSWYGMATSSIAAGRLRARMGMP
jgi:hypothetical protein